MARKKLQYPSISRVIKVPTPYPVVPGSFFPQFSQPAPINKVAAHQQPSVFSEVARVVLAVTPATLVFTKFSEPAVHSGTQGYIDVDVSNTAQAITPAPTQTAIFTQFSEPSRLRTPPPSFDDGWTGLQVVQNFVFSQFTQPTVVKPQQLQSQFVGDRGPAQTPPWFVFSDFGIAPKTRITPSDIQFTTFPTPAVIIVAGGFQDWDPPSRSKIIQEGFVTSTPFLIQVTPTPSSLVFSPFEQPQFRPTKAVIPDVTNTTALLTTTITQVYIFSSFDQAQLSSRIFHQAGHFIFPVAASPIIQPYVFSPFEQPQFKKLFLDTPTQFTTVQAPQPYIFSRFEQPQFGKLFLDTGVQFQSLTISNPIPPVFTGFNDFGLSQQLIGSQRKQDGSSVDFRILQPIFVPSVVQFGGWYDFGLRPAPTSFKAYEQPQVVYEILVPPVPLESAFAGKRWKYQETKKTPEIKNKVLPLKSSNLAAMSYDEDKKELRLTFKTYKYENVSKKKVQNLSHGEYFQKHIKAKHPTTKV